MIGESVETILESFYKLLFNLKKSFLKDIFWRSFVGGKSKFEEKKFGSGVLRNVSFLSLFTECIIF